MKDWAAIQTYKSGTFPNVLAIDSTGAATPDGTEYIAAQINNAMFGPMQDLMDYAGLTPDGVIEAAGTGQIKEAIQKGNAIGPGMYVQRAIYDSPAVNGDRVIILAEQGVLIASYPELTAAVYVGDANNAAVAAAGGKFYKSSDAAGATPNIAGPYIQLPAQPEPKFLKQYSQSNGDFTVSGTNWTTTRAVAVPYKTIGGGFRLVGNIGGTVSIAAATLSLAMSGITSKNVVNYLQPISISSTNQDSQTGYINSNSNVFQVLFSVSGSRFLVSFDIELESWPTWADDFDIEWGITY